MDGPSATHKVAKDHELERQKNNQKRNKRRKEKKRLTRFIATRLLRRRRRDRRLFFTSTLFTRGTCNGLDRNGWIVMVHRCRNNQTIRRVRRHRWRHRTGRRRLRNDMMRGLDPSRTRGTGGTSKGDL